MAIDGNIEIHASLKAVSEELANQAGSKDSMTYDTETNSYYVNDVTEDILKDYGFKYIYSDTEKRPIYKYYDILVSLSTSPANGVVTVYKEWRESPLDYPYKEEVK